MKGEQLLWHKLPAEYYSSKHKIQPPYEIFVESEEPSESLVLTQMKIESTCNDIKNMLLEKNRAYGNSSLDPASIFDIPQEAKIQARIEDKLSRLRNIDIHANREAYIDTIKDLIGYLILYLIFLEE